MIYAQMLDLADLSARILADPEGSLDLRDLTYPFELPEDLTIPGDLILSNCQIYRLPRIRVAGCTFCKGAALRAISAGSFFGGGLSIAGTNVTEIPDDITCCGDLNASGLEIRKIGSNLTVLGAALFSGCALPSFPSSAVFRGVLNCSDARFAEPCPFPENFRTGGDLIIDGAALERLPFGLRCKSLFARYLGGIRFSPGTVIHGDTSLDGSTIRGIPEGIRFCGSVSICDAVISRIPGNTIILADLILYGTPLREICEGAVFRDLYLEERQNVAIHPGAVMLGNIRRNERPTD